MSEDDRQCAQPVCKRCTWRKHSEEWISGASLKVSSPCSAAKIHHAVAQGYPDAARAAAVLLILVQGCY